MSICKKLEDFGANDKTFQRNLNIKLKSEFFQALDSAKKSFADEYKNEDIHYLITQNKLSKKRESAVGKFLRDSAFFKKEIIVGKFKPMIVTDCVSFVNIKVNKSGTISNSSLAQNSRQVFKYNIKTTKGRTTLSWIPMNTFVSDHFFERVMSRRNVRSYEDIHLQCSYKVYNCAMASFFAVYSNSSENGQALELRPSNSFVLIDNESVIYISRDKYTEGSVSEFCNDVRYVVKTILFKENLSNFKLAKFENLMSLASQDSPFIVDACYANDNSIMTLNRSHVDEFITENIKEWNSSSCRNFLGKKSFKQKINDIEE